MPGRGTLEVDCDSQGNLTIFWFNSSTFKQQSNMQYNLAPYTSMHDIFIDLINDWSRKVMASKVFLLVQS